MPGIKVDRQKLKEEVHEKVQTVKTARSFNDLIRAVALDVATLSEEEVKTLVDGATVMDETQKTIKDTVDSCKMILLSYAKLNGLRKLIGTEGFAEISDSVSFSLSAEEAIKILKKEGKGKLLGSVLKVAVTEFRKYLGSDLFEKNAKKEVTEFGRISLKKLKKAGK